MKGANKIRTLGAYKGSIPISPFLWLLALLFSAMGSCGLFVDPTITSRRFFTVIMICVILVKDGILMLRGRTPCFSKVHMYVGIVAAGSLVALLAIIKLLLYEKLPARGNFENPVGLSSFLCLSFPFTISMAAETSGFKRMIGRIGALLIILAVVASESRTGILCIVLMLSTAGLHRKECKKIFIPVLLLLVVCAFIFVVKQDSTDGRFFIWKRTWGLFMEKFWTGHGLGGFRREYMLRQADFFSNHCDSMYAYLADNIKHPNSEILLLLVNHGVLGVAAVLIFIFFIFREKRLYLREHWPVSCSLWSLLFFSLFSYPFSFPHVWLFCLIPFIVLKEEPNQAKAVNALSGFSRFFLAGILWVLMAPSLFSEVKWGDIVRARNTSWDDKKQSYKSLISERNSNPYILYNYAYVLFRHGEYDEAQVIAEKCQTYWADYDLQLLYADILREKEEDSSNAYKIASNMCPNRFIPLYRLFELSVEEGDMERAMMLAEEILHKPIKVESHKIDIIKSKCEDFLKSVAY